MCVLMKCRHSIQALKALHLGCAVLCECFRVIIKLTYK